MKGSNTLQLKSPLHSGSQTELRIDKIQQLITQSSYHLGYNSKL